VNVRTRLLNLLLMAALALAASRLWLFLREPPPVLPAIGPSATQPAPETPREQPAPPVEVRPESFEVIVARDVFSSARGVVPPAPPAAAKPPDKPPTPPKIVLSGVVILDGEKSAYLQEGTQEVRPRKIREGEHFAGGVVQTIRPDGITFLFGGDEIAIPLRSPKEGQAAAQVQAPAQSPAPGAGAAQRPAAPVPIPRRLNQPVVQQGRPAVPARQVPPATVVPRFTPPAEPAEEDTGGEELFPDDSEVDEPGAVDEGLEE
jgi:hypothetical protein